MSQEVRRAGAKILVVRMLRGVERLFQALFDIMSPESVVRDQ
jgi:hypothetical protein